MTKQLRMSVMLLSRDAGQTPGLVRLYEAELPINCTVLVASSNLSIVPQTL